MPTYEYQCSSCDNVKEEFQFINDPPISCERCGIEMNRVLNGAPMIRKGAGLYSIDTTSEPRHMGKLEK